jgi:hypothetical protein
MCPLYQRVGGGTGCQDALRRVQRLVEPLERQVDGATYRVWSVSFSCHDYFSILS